ncbi:holo-ACP synthase [Aerococcaceae bacterium DSM 111020]|nr:holo-ACP synthase [Aerococcaceae bacterium DSM 111020]
MRIGTDIIEIRRIREVIQRNQRFAEKVLTSEEFKIYERYPLGRREEFLAGRFSAKEAYGKALRTGVGTSLKFTDIEILPNELGIPFITKGPVIKEAQVSISHTKEYATAMVLIELTEMKIQEKLKHFERKKERK